MPDTSQPLRASARRVFHPITRPMSLTPEHVARTRREVADPGDDLDFTPLTDADYAAMTEGLMQGHEAPLWIFAYGSLIWNPGFPVGRIRPAVAHGWHRSFCLELTSWRGSREIPGLMMALERGGSTTGLLMEIAPGQEAEGLDALLRREMPGREHADMARWIKTRSAGEEIRALTFWAGPKGPFVTPGLPPETVAWRLAHACGHAGSGAEYLYSTVAKMDEYWLRDRNLWHLQHLVAEEVARWGESTPPSAC